MGKVLFHVTPETCGLKYVKCHLYAFIGCSSASESILRLFSMRVGVGGACDPAPLPPRQSDSCEHGSNGAGP